MEVQETGVDLRKLMRMICVVAAIALLSFIVFGCGTFGNGKIDLVTPYEAGRIFVFVDVTTEPIQPAEVKAVVSQIYAIASVNLDVDNPADELVREQIAKAYPDATPEYREVLFNLYHNLTIKLTSQIEANPKIPRIEVLSEFNRGIRDALALYKPEG